MPSNNSPLFASQQIEQIEKLYGTFSQEQLLWMSGYSAGLSSYSKLFGSVASSASNEVAAILAPEVIGAPKRKLTILYGSHSGNCKGVATGALKVAEGLGLEASVIDLSNYKIKNIKNEQDLLIVVSTHGQGVPPMAAEELYAFLHGKKAPGLEGVRFGVIALGDSSYKLFCQTGSDFYNQLESLGAKPVANIAMLDVDFKDTIDSVIKDIVGKFSGESDLEISANTSKQSSSVASDEIFEAELTKKVLLNGKGSEKETYHLEVSLEGSDLSYKPGDALEVFATNNLELVDKILAQLQIDPEYAVLVAGKSVSIREALHHHYEITLVTPQVVKKIAETVGNDNLKGLLSSGDAFEKYLFGSDILDILVDYSIDLTAKQLTDVLRKLPGRLYSICSSLDANPEEVHITVGAVRFEKNKRGREGVASTFLADRVPKDGKLAIRIKSNDGFRLPQDGNTPIIMVGPGTGIAPFRAFVQQRESDGAKGKNWLVFGDQHFTTDFLYQAEWLKLRESGVLSRLDVAFSRDQQEKIYVQQRLLENGAEVFKYLEQGGYFYVCGDMKRMAKDVKDTLLQIIETEGKLTKFAAADYLYDLRKTLRYQEDVY